MTMHEVKNNESANLPVGILGNEIEIPTGAAFENRKSKFENPMDWLTVAHQVRLQQYELSQLLFAAARDRILAIRAGVASKNVLGDVARFVDVASKLARLATGAAESPAEPQQSAHDADMLLQYEQAINDIVQSAAIAKPVASPAESESTTTTTATPAPL